MPVNSKSQESRRFECSGRMGSAGSFFSSLKCLPPVHALYLSSKSEVRFVQGILFYVNPIRWYGTVGALCGDLDSPGSLFHYLNTIRTIWGKRAARNKINKSNCTSIEAFMNPYAASFFLLSAPATHFAFLSREEVVASLLSRVPASVCVLETYLFYNSPSIPISNGVRGLLTRVESTSTSERLYMCYKLFCSALWPIWVYTIYGSVASAHLHILLWIFPPPLGGFLQLQNGRQHPSLQQPDHVTYEKIPSGEVTLWKATNCSDISLTSSASCLLSMASASRGALRCICGIQEKKCWRRTANRVIIRFLSSYT